MSQNKIYQLIKDFMSNRDDLNDYNNVLQELFLHYVPSDEFASLPREERAMLVDVCGELKELINKLIEVKRQESQPVCSSLYNANSQ